MYGLFQLSRIASSIRSLVTENYLQKQSCGRHVSILINIILNTKINDHDFSTLMKNEFIF